MHLNTLGATQISPQQRFAAGHAKPKVDSEGRIQVTSDRPINPDACGCKLENIQTYETTPANYETPPGFVRSTQNFIQANPIFGIPILLGAGYALLTTILPKSR